MEQSKQADIRLPVIAIGGIETADIPLLIQTGIHGVAVSGALTNKTDTASALNQLQQHFNATDLIYKGSNNKFQN